MCFHTYNGYRDSAYTSLYYRLRQDKPNANPCISMHHTRQFSASSHDAGVQSSPIAHALQTIGMHGALGAGKCVESYKEYSASNNIKSPTLPPYWGGGRLTGRGASCSLTGDEIVLTCLQQGNCSVLLTSETSRLISYSTEGS